MKIERSFEFPDSQGEKGKMEMWYFPRYII